MQFSQSLLALVASAAIVAAAPGFNSKRQSSSCVSSYACPFEIMVGGCGTSQLEDGQLRVQASPLSEIADGQVRCGINGTTPTDFTLSNGKVTDQAGRVCEISKQDQFQCSATPDAGATTTGFSVCNGLLAFGGNASFVACLATGDIPGYNIYTANVDRSTVTGCMAVELDVPSCPVSSSSCVASTATVTSTASAVPITVTKIPAAITSTVTNTVTAPAQTVVNTVTAPAQTVVNTVTASAKTVVNTVTAPAQTVVNTVTAPAQTVVNTVTAPAQTVVNTVTAPAQTVVNTVTAPAQTVVNTVTAPAQTVTVTAAVTATKTSSSAVATCTNITRSLGSSNFPTTIEVVKEGSDVHGSSYFSYIGSGNSTIFTFNPVGSSGQCSLEFLFPTTAEIQAAGGTTAYALSASSISVTLYTLQSVAALTDTYANKPARVTGYPATLTPGSNSTFVTFACPSSQASYELVADDSNTLSFFEDYNLPALGLVQASCA